MGRSEGDVGWVLGLEVGLSGLGRLVLRERLRGWRLWFLGGRRGGRMVEVEVEVKTVMLVDCGDRGVRMTSCVVAVWTTCLDGDGGSSGFGGAGIVVFTYAPWPLVYRGKSCWMRCSMVHCQGRNHVHLVR